MFYFLFTFIYYLTKRQKTLHLNAIIVWMIAKFKCFSFYPYIWQNIHLFSDNLLTFDPEVNWKVCQTSNQFLIKRWFNWNTILWWKTTFVYTFNVKNKLFSLCWMWCHLKYIQFLSLNVKQIVVNCVIHCLIVSIIKDNLFIRVINWLFVHNFQFFVIFLFCLLFWKFSLFFQFISRDITKYVLVLHMSNIRNRLLVWEFIHLKPQSMSD